MKREISFTGHTIAIEQLLPMSEVFRYLEENGATDRAIADFRERYNDAFGDELIWLYPISDSCSLGGLVMPVQEGFRWLPYDSIDREDGETLELDDAELLDADALAFLIESGESYFAALLNALRDAKDTLDHSANLFCKTVSNTEETS